MGLLDVAEPLALVRNLLARLQSLHQDRLERWTPKDRGALERAEDVVADCERKARELQAIVGSVSQPQKLHGFLSTFVPKVSEVRPGRVMLVPAGWRRPDGQGRAVLLVVQRVEGVDAKGHELPSTWNLSVVNTGAKHGLQYHPSTARFPPCIKRQAALTLKGIPRARLLSSTFWFMVFKPLVYPAQANGPELFYQSLLPFLNSKPLIENVSVHCAICTKTNALVGTFHSVTAVSVFSLRPLAQTLVFPPSYRQGLC
jgi:hypothetical protein